MKGPIAVLRRLSVAAFAVAGACGMVTDSNGAERVKTSAPIAIEGDASPRPWTRYPGWTTRNFSGFNSLASTASPPVALQPRKLDGPIVGDPAIGRQLVADRRRGGSCLACHIMGTAGNADLPGNVGPDLSEIGNAGRDDEWLFNYVFDPRVYNPETIMPPWGTHGVFNDSEIGHIVAFLKTLKEPARFASALDDPRKRPTPEEKRDNLDPLVNPGMWAVEKAQELWKTPGPNGSSCVSCHANPEAELKTWAASMPYWEPRLHKVLGVEEFVTRHAKATTGQVFLMQSDENTALAVYLRYLANGTPIHLDQTSAEAREAYSRGMALTTRKIGQLNVSCADCHSPDKGGLKWVRGQWLGQLRGQLDHFPTWRTSQQSVWDIRKRFQWCNVAIGADDLPPDAKEYGDLEFYLAAQNDGLKLNVPGIRH